MNFDTSYVTGKQNTITTIIFDSPQPYNIEPFLELVSSLTLSGQNLINAGFLPSQV